jgi:hypothetical protein
VAEKKSRNDRGDLRFVPCRVEPGMFRGEYLVYLDALNPNRPDEEVHAQLFVDERDVRAIQGTPSRNQPVPAWLAVSLVRTSHGFAQIVLPQPAQPLGDTLLIDEDKIKQKVDM